MRWHRLAPDHATRPQARSSHSITSIHSGEELIMWGGEHAPRVPVDNSVWVYHMPSGAWKCLDSTTGSAPSPRLGHAAAAVGSTVYIQGGRTEVAESTTLSDFFSLDVPTATWTALAPAGVSPPERNYHAACSLGSSLFVFGGCGQGGRMADLWRYDTVAGAWQELPRSDAIKGRGGPGFVSLGESLWALGGFIGAEASDVHRFDLRAGKWEQVAFTSASGESQAVTFSARSVFAKGAHSGCSGLCSHENHIVVYGGEVDPSSLGHAGAGQFAGDVLCLDTAARSWHSLEVAGQAPCARGWAASTEVPAGVVISGGLDTDNARLGDLFLLDMHA